MGDGHGLAPGTEQIQPNRRAIAQASWRLAAPSFVIALER
jgi:hypothetical protein